MSVVHGSVALCTGDRCSNELSLQPLAETQADSARGRALGTGYSWNRDAPGWGWEHEALVGCSDSPAFESLFFFLVLLICLGPTGVLVSRKKSNLEEGLLQRRESLGFGL